MTRDQFVAALGWIFEDSPWVAERAWAQRPFASIEALHRSMTGEVEKAAADEQLALLRAHPDLGTRAKMSAASAGEQSGAGLDRLTAEEFEAFERLNVGVSRKIRLPVPVRSQGQHQARYSRGAGAAAGLLAGRRISPWRSRKSTGSPGFGSRTRSE